MAKRSASTAIEPKAADPPPPPVPPAPEAVLDWLLKGHNEHNIREALAVKYPGADPVAVMAAVEKYLTDAGNPDRDRLRGWLLTSSRELYRRMIEIGDFDGARKVLMDMAKLAGL